MKIIDTIPYFMENYESSLGFLRGIYYKEYPEIFEEYFAYHCQDSDERLLQAIEKYPQFLSIIKQVHKNIIPIISEVIENYNRIYQVSFPIEVNLIVGGFGSNAYTYRQIIPNITFALERLSPEPNHLRTIVAHEFGHAAHNIISNESGMNWKKLNWGSPLTWLIQEGAAMHFSRKVAPELPPSVYFYFNDEGEEWLAFAKSNQNEIKDRFSRDLETKPPQMLFREWFSIRGGETFGFDRLGYFIADMFFQSQIKKLGEIKAIVAWKEADFEDQVTNWLKHG